MSIGELFVEVTAARARPSITSSPASLARVAARSINSIGECMTEASHTTRGRGATRGGSWRGTVEQ